MSISTPATTTVTPPRYPQIPARAGNANVRAVLAHGVHPASRQPLADTPGSGCGSCALAYRIQLPAPDRDGESIVREHLKCSKAPVSRRGRQGIDLRSDTPACTLHCRFTDWPFDPDGFNQSAVDPIGTGKDHPDDDGVYAVYRIFGIDSDYQRVWVELDAEMIPDASPGGYVPRPTHPSKPDKPHLYRFWTELSRLHTAHIGHPVDAGHCTHPLVRNGRVLLGRLGS
jgi:hypothetical protein